MEKLKFSIDDIRMLDEANDEQFALVQMDVFASGPNLHDMTTNVETLKRTAKTILLKPLVAIYDKYFDDLGSHDEKQIAIGVVPNDAEIKFRELEDGRTMMMVNALIWKHYSHNMLEFFKRDGGSKPISVEMQVLSTKEEVFEDGAKGKLTELIDYCFSAITLLGSTVTPAIPMAQAQVIRFAIDEKIGFSNIEEIDLWIPQKVKENARDALNMFDDIEIDNNANSISLAVARHLIKNDKLSLEKFRQLQKYIPKKFKPNDLNSLLWGGYEFQEWLNDRSKKLSELDLIKSTHLNIGGNLEKMSDENNKKEETLMTKKKEDEIFTESETDVKEFETPESEDVDMAKPTDETEEDKSNEFSKNEEEVDMSTETEVDMAKPVDEDKETPKDEVEETPAEQEKEDKEGTEKKFSLDAYLDVAAVLCMLENETEQYRALVAACHSEDGMNEFAVGGVMSAMYEKMSKLEAENKTYMAENEELKKFKSDYDATQKSFAVDATLKEAETNSTLTKEELDAAREDAKNFTINEIDGWKNKVFALAFTKKKAKEKEEPIMKKYAILESPFSGKVKVVDSPWTGNVQA